jgi:hypothetical protein
MQTNGTYSKLANLGIIDTHDLIFLGSAKAEAGNEVHDEKDNAGSKEGISHSGDRVSKLVSQLDIVLVDPATINLGDTIKVRNVVSVPPS